MRRPLALAALAIPLLCAPPALAQQPPAKATIQLKLQRVGHSGRAVAFTGRAFRVRGLVYPYVAGQRVRVRFLRGAATLRTRSVAVRPLGATGNGTFVADFATRVVGAVRVGATHEPTPQMAYAHARAGPVEVIRDHAAYGERSRTVRVMQRLLRDAGYVVGDYGVLDARTSRAVLAFRKLSGLPRTTEASPVVMRRLVNGGGRFAVRFPSHGRHAEVDLSHQVLALVARGRVDRIYPISSGKPSTPTVLGSYRIYLRQPGTNAKGMVFSSYFIGGYAIHGYADVPIYPASHGCVRVPVPDAVPIFNWLAMGDRVDVYYRTPGHRRPRPRADAGP